MSDESHSGKLVQFTPRVIHSDADASWCVNHLREVLAAAERGEIVGIAIATENHQGQIGTAFHYVSAAKLLGALELLRHKIVNDWSR